MGGHGQGHRVLCRTVLVGITDPPRIPVPTYVTPFRDNDDFPLEEEVEAAVRCLRCRKSVGHTHLCAECFKQCIREVYLYEGVSAPPRAGALEEASGYNPIHMSARVDPNGSGM